jgi:hypothetical protein
MEPKKLTASKHLCLPGLLQRARKNFEGVKDTVSRKVNLSIAVCLMSGLSSSQISLFYL